MNTTAFPSPRGCRVSNRSSQTLWCPEPWRLAPSTGASSNDVSWANRKYSALDEGRRLAASEIADQVAKSRWLRIQCINHVFGLTLTVQSVRWSYLHPHQLVWISDPPDTL